MTTTIAAKTPEDINTSSYPWSASLGLIAPLLLYRLALLLLIELGLMLMPMPFFRIGTGMVNASGVTFLEACSTWDAPFYLHISQVGYSIEHGDANFFPLWPACIHLATLITGNPALAAVILANLLAVAASVLIHRLALLRFGKEAAWATTLLLLAAPTSFFFALPYSESLFLFLAVGLLLALHQNQRVLVWIAGFLLVFARPVGFFCIFAIVVDQWMKRKRLWAIALASGPLLGLAGYFILMKILTGDALANMHHQNPDFGGSATRLLHPLVFLQNLFRSDIEITGYHNSAIDRCLFALSVAAIYPIARRSLVDLAYFLPMAFVPAMTNAMVSYSRYFLVAFPVFLIGGQLFSRTSRRPWLFVVIAFSFAIQIFMLIRHTHGFWVG